MKPSEPRAVNIQVSGDLHSRKERTGRTWKELLVIGIEFCEGLVKLKKGEK